MSPLNMRDAFHMGADLMDPAVRPLRHGCWDRLHELVARAVCFEPDVKDISRIAQLRGVSKIPRGASFVQAVLSLVSELLGE